MSPLKDERAACEHQPLVAWKVDYLQDVDARGIPGDFFDGLLSAFGGALGKDHITVEDLDEGGDRLSVLAR